MLAFPVTLQRGVTRFHGHLFLAPTRLYYVNGRQGYAWGGGSRLVAGLVNAHRSAAADEALAATLGVAPGTAVDEHVVYHATMRVEGSILMEAAELALVRHDWWWRGFKWKNGSKIGLLESPSELVRELALWTAANRVPSKGLA